MGEALPKYTPANDQDGEEVSLKIISSIDKTSDRFDNLRPERFTESHQNDDDLEEEGEMESYGVDSPEGLLKAREYTRSLSSALSEWEASPGDVYDNGRIVLDYLRQQISDINDLIRYQNDAFASGAADKEIQQRAEKIVEAINLLSADYESLSIAAEDETGTVMAELADEVRGMKNLEKTVETKSEEENKTGWWNREFQTEQGISRAGADGDLKQVWGDQDGPIGFEPEVVERDENKERTGWWQSEYRGSKGFSDLDGDRTFTQRGEMAGAEGLYPKDTDSFVSSPVTGGRIGQVKWSLRNPEELFPESDKPELTAEGIEEYRDWVESIHADASQAETFTSQQAEEMAHKSSSFDEPTVEEVDMESPENQLVYAFLKALNLNEDQIKAMLSKRSTRDRLLGKARKWQQEFGTSAKGDSSGPAAETAAKDTTEKKETSERVTLREEWLEAKHAHAEAEREYLEALEAFYGGFTVRARTTFGFKPDLPDEIKELSRQRAKTAALYSQAADRMVEAKKQEKPVLEKYLERHKRLQARTLLLRTFEDQQNIQKQAAETKYPGVREFFQKHGKKIRYGSAATLGFVTGGILGASYSITRALGGAAVTGQAVQFVGKKYDEKVTAAREKFEADYSAEAEQLISLLQNKGSLNEQELAEVIVKLDELASYVDAATQERIRAVMATAIGVSLAFGGGTAALDDMFFAETVDAQSSTGVPTEEISSVADAAASNDSVVIDVSTDPNAAAVGGAEAAGAPSTTEYTVQRGDNLWDIVEGQTEAGKFAALEGLSEADKQEAIARLAETFNENEELRERFGMGDTADMLYADEKIDTAALNEMLADEIKEHNIGGDAVESPVDSSSNTEAPAGGDAGAGGEAPAAGVDSGAAPTEKVLMKSVSVDAVNEYAREYTGGGYVKFEQDFEKLFVERVQGPAPATGGLMSFIFGGAPNTADAYKLFSPYTIAEFNELNRVSESALAEALAQDGIDINDYRAWRDELRDLRAQGMTINPTDRFEDVAKAAFINSLNQPKTT